MPRTHLFLRVQAEGTPWITDVGFGNMSLTAALLFEVDLAQPTLHENRRIVRDGKLYEQPCSRSSRSGPAAVGCRRRKTQVGLLNSAVLFAVSGMTGKWKSHFEQGTASASSSCARS